MGLRFACEILLVCNVVFVHIVPSFHSFEGLSSHGALGGCCRFACEILLVCDVVFVSIVPSFHSFHGLSSNGASGGVGGADLRAKYYWSVM